MGVYFEFRVKERLCFTHCNPLSWLSIDLYTGIHSYLKLYIQYWLLFLCPIIKCLLLTRIDCEGVHYPQGNESGPECKALPSCREMRAFLLQLCCNVNGASLANQDEIIWRFQEQRIRPSGYQERWEGKGMLHLKTFPPCNHQTKVKGAKS